MERAFGRKICSFCATAERMSGEVFKSVEIGETLNSGRIDSVYLVKYSRNIGRRVGRRVRGRCRRSL